MVAPLVSIWMRSKPSNTKPSLRDASPNRGAEQKRGPAYSPGFVAGRRVAPRPSLLPELPARGSPLGGCTRKPLFPDPPSRTKHQWKHISYFSDLLQTFVCLNPAEPRMQRREPGPQGPGSPGTPSASRRVQLLEAP